MQIIQGSNAPIILEFDEDMSVYEKISVGLYTYSGDVVKTWGKEDMVIEDYVVQCPLTQEETANMKKGIAKFEVKVLMTDGTIIFFDREDVYVTERYDKEVAL